jgi:hypothetical protein
MDKKENLPGPIKQEPEPTSIIFIILLIAIAAFVIGGLLFVTGLI